MSAAYPSSSNSSGASAAATVGATAAGFAQLGMTPFNTSQLMGMAALAAAGGLPPSFNATSSNSANTNLATTNSFGSGLVANLGGGLAGLAANSNSTLNSASQAPSYYQASSNFNMAASLLAQSKSSNVGNNQNYCSLLSLKNV